MRKYFLLILILFSAGIWWAQNIKHSVFDIDIKTSAAIVGITVKQDSPYVQINNVKILVEVAKTEAEVQKGLSGRKSLDANRGMLFIFPQPDYYRFWMPNMHFPIDIIWINENRVVGISQNVPNEFDPKNPKFYTPPRPADQVLEVNVGFAQKKNIKVGDDVIFNDR
ncbi:MAG: DUF192 domain-containing protein [Candidatus Sungbacteria bacterium]|uniref:DUF192 domain-containing protein n=1 Tax=Candidatus Sungiibacteriota bacterium TaxID=2750080 RepID=A0A931YE03_9BACT|nr:DUF192 domain-containing protein [Candidatus Sungbacteria bacterium]